MKIKSNKMKNHKEKYRLERIIRIRSAFHKIPGFWGLFKKILARPPMPTTRWSFYQPIYQFASLWNSMPTTSDSSMKRDAIWGSYHVSFIASPLSLPCSMALKPYLSPILQSLCKSNHHSTHTPLHLWKPSQSTAGTRTTRRNRSSKTTRSTRKRIWANGPRRIF